MKMSFDRKSFLKQSRPFQVDKRSDIEVNISLNSNTEAIGPWKRILLDIYYVRIRLMCVNIQKV